MKNKNSTLYYCQLITIKTYTEECGALPRIRPLIARAFDRPNV